MLGSAVRVADGTVTWMTGPEDAQGLRTSFRSITAAAEWAGQARRPASLPASRPGHDDAAVLQGTGRQHFAIYGTLPSYRAMLDREGSAGPADVAIVGDEDAVAEQVLALGAVRGHRGPLFGVRVARREGADPGLLLGRLVGQAA